jgi:hypothetical protein
MKKILLALTLTAFACVPALQAGEEKACDAAKSACNASACSAKAASGPKCTLAKKLASAEVRGATLLAKR